MSAPPVAAAGPHATDTAELERLRALVEGSPALLWATGPDGQCEFVNAAWLALTGRTLAEELGEGWLQGMHPDDRASAVASYQRSVADGAPMTVEYRIRRHDGAWRWLLGTGAPRRAADGTLLGYSGCCIDVTEQHLAQEALREQAALLVHSSDAVRASEARLRRIAESDIVGLFFWSLDGGISEANDAFLRIVGHDRADLAAGRVDWRAMTPPQYAESDARLVAELLATGRHGPFAKEYVRRDGRPAPVLVASAFFDQSRERGVCVCIDLTEQKRVEAELAEREARIRASEARERATFAHAGVGMARLTVDGRWLEVNDALCAFLGRTRDELLGASFLEVTHPDDVPANAALQEEMRRGRRDKVVVEKRYLRPDGSARWGRATAAVVRDDAGAPAYRVTIIEDITEERRAQAAREQALAHARTLQQLTAAFAGALTREAVARVVGTTLTLAVGAQLGVLAVRAADGTRLDVAAADHLDVPDVDVWRAIPIDAPVPLAVAARASTPVALSTPEEIVARYPMIAAATRARGTRAILAVPVPANARPAAEQAEAAPLGAIGLSFAADRATDADALALATAAARLCAQALERAALYESAEAARGEAERRRIEAEQANRAKSDFLAVMSHELRTPLNAIAGYVELLELGIRGPLTGEQRSDLARVKRSQRHLLALIDEVLTFAKLEAEQMTLAVAPVAVGALFDEVAEVVEPQLRERGLRFETRRPPPDMALRADPDRVRQILLNLLSNAIKFTEPVRRGVPGTVALFAELSDRTVRLSVADTGPGIAAERREDVFHPFVQLEGGLTRRREGTGLGLAISRDLARAMGGDVTVDSEVGVGTCFMLSLPRV